MVTKVTFVGPSFTRKAPKYERFIRPTGLRFTKANVTHPELQVRAFCVPRLLPAACVLQDRVYAACMSPD
jgi:hypothetical protein